MRTQGPEGRQPTRLRAAEFRESAAGEKLFDIERDILPEDWQGMLNELDGIRRQPLWWDFTRLAMQMLILAPERKAELKIDDTAWQGMLDQLNQYRREPNWGNFPYLAMEMAILAPERKAELKIDDTAWQGMLDKLNQYRRESNWGNFARIAMPMAVLSADEVRITDPGKLELVQDPPAEADPALPPRPIV